MRGTAVGCAVVGGRIGFGASATGDAVFGCGGAAEAAAPGATAPAMSGGAVPISGAAVVEPFVFFFWRNMVDTELLLPC